LRPWRSFFQRVYLFFATNPFTAHLLSKYKIKLLPPIDMAEHKLFLGGTTKIRLIDIQNQKVYVILKKGYSDHYYENELTIRNQHKYLPAPKLFEINYDGRWYCEEYISGVSPDRLKYGEADIMGQAIKPLRLLYQSTFQQKSKEEYLKNICNSIHSNLKQSYNRNNYDLNRIISIVDTLYSKLLSKLPSKIAICQNHGDLQPGNILWNAELEKLWIIDWEFTRERQYGFDFFTILLSVRSKVGSAKILHAAEHGISEDNYLLKMFPDLSKGNLEVFLLLFLLEELDFKVEELKYYQLKQKHDGLINYISCLESILNKNI